jgi:hypothetical protein
MPSRPKRAALGWVVSGTTQDRAATMLTAQVLSSEIDIMREDVADDASRALAVDLFPYRGREPCGGEKFGSVLKAAPAMQFRIARGDLRLRQKKWRCAYWRASSTPCCDKYQ